MSWSSKRFSRLRELRLAHQVQVDRPGGLATFGDGPDDQRLTASEIAGSKDIRYRSLIMLVGGDVAADCHIDTELLQQTVANRSSESHSEQYEIGIKLEFGSGHRFKLRRSADTDGM